MWSPLLSTYTLDLCVVAVFFFFFQAEDGIRDLTVTGVQTCALPISPRVAGPHPLCLRARRDAAGSMARRRRLPSARFPPVAVPRQPALPLGAPRHHRRSRMGGRNALTARIWAIDRPAGTGATPRGQ